MKLLVVIFKEIIDNLRDRQTLLYALLFGPVLIPILIGGAMVTSLSHFQIDFEEITELHVENLDSAPNLIEYLYSNNIDAIPAPQDYESQLQSGDIAAVLEITPEYQQALREGTPAPLTIHANEGDKASAKYARKVVSVISGYKRVIDSLRMQHRGIDPSVFSSISVVQNDVSADGARGQLIGSLLPFLFIVSMVLGGFYLAIDTTAGERERQSLEPLLTLPIARSKLVLGKYGATLCFVFLSAVLTALSIILLFPFIPVELLGSRINFDSQTVVKAFLMVCPLVFFVSALLITIAAFTKSSKEAQTYLGLMMVIPMAPFFVLQFVNIKSAALTMALPMLSQYQLLEKVVLQEPVRPLYITLSVAGTLAASAVLLAIAIKLYQRERILF